MNSLPNDHCSRSRVAFKCKWADCKVDLANSTQSVARHIHEDHRLGRARVCEWESCVKTGYVFASYRALMLHIQSEHSKKKYLRSSQPGRDLNHRQLRGHEPSRSTTRITSNMSLYSSGMRKPDQLRRVFSLSSLEIPSLGPRIEIPSALTQHPVVQTGQTRTTERWYIIVPLSPLSPSMANPYSYAKLNDLTGEVRQECEIGCGSFADVYMGTWSMGTTSKKVAIKKIRPYRYTQDSFLKLQKKLRREMRIWGNLDHPNIVPLYGVAFGFGNLPAMVCQWMDQGTLAEYLEKRNLNFRDRLDICIAIAHGLSHLHSHKVIHGDLSPANILMDGDIAHLSDFGLSNVIAELQGPSFFTSKPGGSVRWMAPELLSDNKPELTMTCDVYSFASVASYVITGILPYGQRSDPAIILEILRNIDSQRLPTKPSQTALLTDECWEILLMCWAFDPSERPSIDEVERRLLEL